MTNTESTEKRVPLSKLSVTELVNLFASLAELVGDEFPEATRKYYEAVGAESHYRLERFYRTVKNATRNQLIATLIKRDPKLSYTALNYNYNVAELVALVNGQKDGVVKP